MRIRKVDAMAFVGAAVNGVTHREMGCSRPTDQTVKSKLKKRKCKRVTVG